jgi:pimeloyl-ACP methyl ester carboxylesterase
MPLVSKGKLTVDYTEQGRGDPVVLIHSSVSGNRQWRALGDALADRYRALAINLFGYGETTPWPGNTSQSLYAQACLVLALAEGESKLHLVGHSFGASVALKAALLLGERVGKLVLIEPNPFSLLKQQGRTGAFLEARALRDHVKCFGSVGDWDAVMDEETTLEGWKSVAARTLVLSGSQTRRSIREIVEIFAAACPHWSFQQIRDAGHMAALTHPELVNPLVRQFLDSTPS